MQYYQRTGGGDVDNDERMIKFEKQCRTAVQYYQRTGGGDDDNDERMIKFEKQCRTSSA